MRRSIPREIKPILEELKACLKRIYGDRLEKIILYGSYARKEANKGSDIDIMVLLKDCKDLLEERAKISQALWELDLKYDTLISVIPEHIYRYEKKEDPLILNVKREGIIL